VEERANSNVWRLDHGRARGQAKLDIEQYPPRVARDTPKKFAVRANRATPEAVEASIRQMVQDETTRILAAAQSGEQTAGQRHSASLASAPRELHLNVVLHDKRIGAKCGCENPHLDRNATVGP
jgi:hypothetical protein